jgi:cation diffusion facilitator family transporter
MENRGVERSIMSTERIQHGKLAARNSAVALFLLTLLKGSVGVASGSIALTADALHSLTDVASSLAVWFGLKISERKPDKTFSYGYYKAETMASLLVSLIVLIAGIGIFREAVGGLFQPKEITLTYLTLAVSLLSALASYLLMKYKSNVGERINSPALLADAKHSGVDVYASLVVFSGILFSSLGLPQLESLAGIVVSLIIFHTAFVMGKESLMVLMDACVHPELRDKITQEIYSVKGVRNVHDVKLRRSGLFIFGEAHVEVDAGESVQKAHDKTESIEEKIKSLIKEIDTFTLHVEPIKKTVHRVAVPVTEDKGVKSPLSPHFGKTSFFLFAEVRAGDVKYLGVKENPAKDLEKKIGLTAAKFLIENKTDVLISLGVGEGAYYALKEHAVEMFQPEGETAGENITSFIGGKLLRLEVKV